jgi:hypothetical protein
MLQLSASSFCTQVHNTQGVQPRGRPAYKLYETCSYSLHYRSLLYGTTRYILAGADAPSPVRHAW